MSKIIKVKARQVFDSRGNPTIEAEVFTKNISAFMFANRWFASMWYSIFLDNHLDWNRIDSSILLSLIDLIKTHFIQLTIRREDGYGCHGMPSPGGLSLIQEIITL